jgi:hypothetical protein
MLELEGRVRGRGLDLMPRESHELRLLYDALKVPPLHRVDAGAGRDRRMLEWEVGRYRGTNPANPPGDYEDRLSRILPPMGKTDFYHEELPSYPGRYFTIRRHSDGDLTAAITNMHGVKTGAEVVVPEDRIADVYHYALHHGTLEGWEPESGGYGLGRAKENPSYPAGTVPYYVSIPEGHAKALAEVANKRGIRARAMSHGVRSGTWLVVVPVEQEDEANRLAGAIAHAAWGRKGNPAASPEREDARYFVVWLGPGRKRGHKGFSNNVDAALYFDGMSRKGHRVVMGGAHGSILGYSKGVTESEARKWMDDLIYRSNPAASPEQYRLAQAVLSGTASDAGMPVEAAREIVERTPAGKRSEYSRYMANPQVDVLGKANVVALPTKESAERYLRALPPGYSGRVFQQEHGGWAVSYRYTGTSAERKGNPADGAAALYREFHGVSSAEEVVVTEEVRYHGNLAGLGDLVEIVVKTPSGYKAVLDFDKSGTLLCSSEDGKQLYLRGGDQSIDLDAIHMSGEEWLRDSMLLGTILKLTYRTAKKFDNLKVLDYEHKLGEESGVKPELIYDVLNNQLSVAGGQYDVRPEGVVN